MSFRWKPTIALSLLLIFVSLFAWLLMIKGTTHAASTGTLLKHSTQSRTVTTSFASNCGAWSILSSPNTGVADILNGVVAISSSDVWAVGSEEPTSGVPYQTLTEHWDGSTWSIISDPIIGIYGNTLYGVTALSTNDVWAVGNYYTSSNNGQSLNGHTLVEHWDGTSWNIIASPDVGTVDNILRGVTSVPGSNQLWAVGYAWDTSSFQTLIEHWDGTSWTVVPGASLGTIDNSLAGVMARSMNDIWAVGNYDDVSSSTSQALIEHWDGTTWSMVSSGISNGSLNSITSVPSTNQLWAVGIHTQASGSRQTLTEHWDGTSWSPVPSPSPRSQGPRSLDDLLGVVAIAPNNVWALGYTYHTPTLVERWNGTKWYVASIPLAGSTEIFFGVARVPNSKQLWTVGAYSTSSTSYQTLVEVRC